MVGSYCVLLKRVSLNFFLCMGNGGWAGLFLCFFLVNFQFIFLGFFFFWELSSFCFFVQVNCFDGSLCIYFVPWEF